MINDYFDSMVQFYCPSSLPENEWNLAGMKTKLGWIIGSDSLDELKTPTIILNTSSQKPKSFTTTASRSTERRL